MHGAGMPECERVSLLNAMDTALGQHGFRRERGMVTKKDGDHDASD
jgi:hypothetical protein